MIIAMMKIAEIQTMQISTAGRMIRLYTLGLWDSFQALWKNRSKACNTPKLAVNTVARYSYANMLLSKKWRLVSRKFVAHCDSSKRHSRSVNSRRFLIAR
jgi:hypothetical protein